MKTCILHVGMPKTGTSSIQESLYSSLADPSFHYVSLCRVNAADTLALLCSERPQDHWAFRIGGQSKTRLRAMRATSVWRLRRALRRARNCSQTPIISAETCWAFPPSDLERLRDFLAAEGFEPRVIAYLRPIKSWYESVFQQQTKVGFWEFDPFSRFQATDGHPLRSWSHAIERLARVFGQRNLMLRPFVRSSLVEGCVVCDFCRMVGIASDPRAVVHSNESLSADAVRFLYAYNRFHAPGIPTSYHGRMLLIQQFTNLGGGPFRFHSEVFAPLVETIAAEERTLRERYGVDISEDLRGDDVGSCVRERADLFRYGRPALEWLAEASGLTPINGCEGESAAREVAAQVHAIQRRQSWRTRRESLAGPFRDALRWIRHGD